MPSRSRGGATRRRQFGVTHVTSRYPPDVGGMERVVGELAQSLAAELSVPVDVVTGAGRNRGSEREGRVLVRRLRSFGVLVTPVIPGLAWDLLRRPRPQILHVHIAHAGTPEIAALIAWVRGIPLVAHVHIDASPTTWLGCLLGLYQRLLLSKVLAHAALVLVPTASYRTLVIDKYRLDPGRVRVLPNGTRMASREPLPARRWTSDSPIRLLSVGRVAPEKNLPLLIDAVDALINVEHLDVELEIVGDGPAWNRVAQHIVNRGLTSRVHLVGRRAGDELVASYDRADIFVMTSLSESFGMVLVEAMARGVPVIAPDITGVRDVVIDGSTGLLVDHSVASICDAILRLVRTPGLREKVVAGARLQSPRYSWPTIARQCAGMYEELLPRSDADASAGGLTPSCRELSRGAAP